jgi:hypothetical protein
MRMVHNHAGAAHPTHLVAVATSLLPQFILQYTHDFYYYLYLNYRNMSYCGGVENPLDVAKKSADL